MNKAERCSLPTVLKDLGLGLGFERAGLLVNENGFRVWDQFGVLGFSLSGFELQGV